MKLIILLLMLTSVGTTSAIHCLTFSATNWTWPDKLIEKWLIYPHIAACSSQTVRFHNLSKDTYYGAIDTDHHYVKNIWIDGSNLEEANMRDFSFRTLRISNSVFANLRLPGSLKSIHLQNVPIKEVSSYDSDDFEKLHTWSGKNISIKSLHLGSFNKRYLKTLQITNGNLSWFQVGSLFYSLETLDLHENKLLMLPYDLNNLLAVKNLNFSKNRLEFLEMDLFDGLHNLKELDLSYNRLSVRTYFSVQLPALERLTMNYCDLKSLNVLYWEMPNLEILNLENNPHLAYVIHMRNHFSDDTIIQITNVENWCCDWLNAANKHFKIEHLSFELDIEQRSTENGGCRYCSISSFYEPFPERSAEEQFRMKLIKRHQQ